MEEDVWRQLRARSAQIDARWEMLLRGERVRTPLANPDALARLIPWAREEILEHAPIQADDPAHNVTCLCGRNPFIAFYTAGEQAILEALVQVQCETAPLEASVRDRTLARLHTSIRAVKQREVAQFCLLCQRK
jgi:hypothetical protein